MNHAWRAGAVLYARDLNGVGAFYSAVTGLKVRRTEPDHVVLESAVFQLVILRIPERVAASMAIEVPTVRRETTPIKLVFFVESIADARIAAGLRGGALDAVDRQWQFDGSTVCDGVDPEGNVFQLREIAR